MCFKFPCISMLQFLTKVSVLFALLNIFTLRTCATPHPKIPLHTLDAGPSSSPSQGVSGHRHGGVEHVVIFTKDAPHARDVLKRVDLSPEHEDVHHVFDNPMFGGFVASFKSHCFHALNNMTDVERVEESAEIRSLETAMRPNTRWNLQRISSLGPLIGTQDSSQFHYTFDDPNPSDPSPGKGVDIYIVDSGINYRHEDFDKRAAMVYAAPGLNSIDDNGHGTNVASIAGGSMYGVASNASLQGVKVLGADGTGSTSGILQGLDWVARQHAYRVQNADFVGTVINLSWGMSGVSDAIESVIQILAKYGAHVTIAAGNDFGNDSCAYSPARLGGNNSSSIVTVGAMRFDGAIAALSNTGPCVDIYAPGEDVFAAYKDSDTSYASYSGTSQAAPHVAGLMAYLLAKDPSLKFDTTAMKARIMGMAQAGLVHSNNATAGDRGLLLNNGMDGSPVDNLPYILPSDSRRLVRRTASRVNKSKSWLAAAQHGLLGSSH